MWKLIEQLNNQDWFYSLIGERISDRRIQKIAKMTNQKKLYKIFLTEQVGWLKALDMITDPIICEEIYRSEHLQPRLKRFGSYFANRTELIDRLNDKATKQALYIEAIQQELDTVKNDYKRYGNQIKNQDHALENSMLHKMKYLVNYIDRIENIEQRKNFILLAADICDHAPTSVLVRTTYIDGRWVQPKNETKEFGRELRCRVKGEA